MQNLTTCLLAPPVNEDFFATDLEDTITSSSDYEVFGVDFFKRVKPLYSAIASSEVQYFKNVLSDVAALLTQFSTSKSFELSKEEDYINRCDLYNAVDQAHICVLEIFGRELSTTLEYCSDTEDSSLEWLDFNLSYDSVEDEDIERLLDQVDELSSKFEGEVGVEVASNVNFYLDIK